MRERDSEGKFTALICRSSNSAPLFIKLSRQQLLTKICQVSALFNFRPNALQHGSLPVRARVDTCCTVSSLSLFVHPSRWCILSHSHSCAHLYNAQTHRTLLCFLRLQIWEVAALTFSTKNPAVRQKLQATCRHWQISSLIPQVIVRRWKAKHQG